MDNLTHSLAGWALGQAGLKTKTRKGLAALILGANMPDIDVFFGWVPWIPLATHRGFTHGLVGGVLLLPPLLAVLLWLFDRWQVRRGEVHESGLTMHFGWLVALSYIGALTHPSLDLLTTYSVQLLSPLSNAWYHADGLFIIDVWLWLLLGGAIFWSKRREKRGREWRRPVQGAITIALAYIGLNLLITDRAAAAVREVSPTAQSIFASPSPALFWRRTLVWREADCYRHGSFDPLSGLGPTGNCEPSGLDHPLVRQAIRSDPALRKYLRWSILPFAVLEQQHCLARITIGDARYGSMREGSRISMQSVVPASGPGC